MYYHHKHDAARMGSCVFRLVSGQYNMIIYASLSLYIYIYINCILYMCIYTYTHMYINCIEGERDNTISHVCIYINYVCRSRRQRA